MYWTTQTTGIGFLLRIHLALKRMTGKLWVKKTESLWTTPYSAVQNVCYSVGTVAPYRFKPGSPPPLFEEVRFADRSRPPHGIIFFVRGAGTQSSSCGAQAHRYDTDSRATRSDAAVGVGIFLFQTQWRPLIHPEIMPVSVPLIHLIPGNLPPA